MLSLRSLPVPPRKLLPYLVLGFLIALGLNLILSVAFLGSILAALVVQWIEVRRIRLMGLASWWLYIVGAQALVGGTLLVFGVGIVSAVSIAMSQFSSMFAVGGILLGLIVLALGFVAFWLGNVFRGR